MSDDDPVFSSWGRPVRVRIDHAPVWSFARSVRDENPVFASETSARDAGFDAVPVPPTFTFVMSGSGAYPDLQPEAAVGPMLPADSGLPADGFSGTGLYLHGEQHFTYHRQPVVGDVLEGRMRVSAPIVKQGSRGRMEQRIIQTEWSEVDGAPVVTEQVVSLYLPDA
jgi:hypothetical protein